MLVGKITAAKDPAMYAQGIADVAPGLVRALGLDLGLSCGVAMTDFDPAQPVIDNTLYLDLWNLDVGSFDSNIVRFVRLRQFLEVVQPQAIFYEDVKHTPPLARGGKVRNIMSVIAQASTNFEFFGGLKACVGSWAEDRGIPCAGIGPTELKRWATTKGNASKEQMVEACNKKFGMELPVEDCEKHRSDDLADASFVLDWGISNYGKGLNGQARK